MIISKKICNSKVENILLERIQKAYRDDDKDNSQKASDYCDILIEGNSSNIYAILYKALVNQGWTYEDISNYSSVIKSAQKCMDIAKSILDTDEYYDFCTSAMEMIGSRLGKIISSLHVTFRYVRKQYERDPSMDQAVIRKNCSDLASAISSALSKVVMEISACYSTWMKNADIQTTPKSLVEAVASSVDSMKKTIKNTEDERWYINTQSLDDAVKQCDIVLSNIHKLAVEKYWEAHPDEKAELENDIIEKQKEIEKLEAEKTNAEQEIKAEITESEKKIEILEEEFKAAKNKILAEISSMEEEKSKQGLFAFGAKKDLKNKIEQQQSALYDLERENIQKVNELEDKIDNIKEKGRTVSKRFFDRITDVKVQIEKTKSIIENKEN